MVWNDWNKFFYYRKILLIHCMAFLSWEKILFYIQFHATALWTYISMNNVVIIVYLLISLFRYFDIISSTRYFSKSNVFLYYSSSNICIPQCLKENSLIFYLISLMIMFNIYAGNVKIFHSISIYNVTL